MCARQRVLPSRNCFAAASPYTEPIAFDIAPLFLSSCPASAGKLFCPPYPACVAQIASRACSPRRLSSVTRRSAAVVADLGIGIPSWLEWPDADATTARANTASRANDVFRFFTRDLRGSVDEAHSHE